MRHRIPFLLSLILFLLAILFLAACNPDTTVKSVLKSILPNNPATPTATETPTVTEAPSSTDISTGQIGQITPIVVEQPTKVLSPSPMPTSANLEPTPVAQLTINRPGPESKLSSPIIVNAFTHPGSGRKVTVQLYGEDGRLMAEQLINLQKSETGWVSFSAKIPFEINTATESAFLVLVTYDDFGRRLALINNPIILMQIGDDETMNAGFKYQPFYVEQPDEDAEISGGVLHVEGYAHPFNLNPIIIELIKENGAVLSTQIVPIKAAAENANYIAFSTNIAYKVTEDTPVRLTIRQMMDHAPYLDLALSSMTITLKQ